MYSLLDEFKIVYSFGTNPFGEKIVTASFKNDWHSLKTIYEKHCVTDKGYYFRNFDIDIDIDLCKLKGVAVCEKEDEYDISFGIKLARKKLMIEFYRTIRRSAKRHCEIIEATLLTTIKNVLKEAESKEHYYTEQIKYISQNAGK